MKAAEINGGLYILFMEVRVNTIMGPESIVGDRYSWTLEELLGTLLFLLDNDAAGFITGVVIPVDGGFSAYSGV